MLLSNLDHDDLSSSFQTSFSSKELGTDTSKIRTPLVMSSAALVKYMGCVKILVACAMAARPQAVYNSPLAQKVAKRTRLASLPPSVSSRPPL